MIPNNPEHVEALALQQYLQQVTHSFGIKLAQATSWATLDEDDGLRMMVEIRAVDPPSKLMLKLGIRMEIKIEDDDSQAGEGWKEV